MTAPLSFEICRVQLENGTNSKANAINHGYGERRARGGCVRSPETRVVVPHSRKDQGGKSSIDDVPSVSGLGVANPVALGISGVCHMAMKFAEMSPPVNHIATPKLMTENQMDAPAECEHLR